MSDIDTREAHNPNPVEAAHALLQTPELPPSEHALIAEHIHADGGVHDHVVEAAAASINLSKTSEALHRLAKIANIDSMAELRGEEHRLERPSIDSADLAVAAVTQNAEATSDESSEPVHQEDKVTEIDPQNDLDLKGLVAEKDGAWVDSSVGRVRSNSRSRTNQYAGPSAAVSEMLGASVSEEASAVTEGSLSDIRTEVEEGIEEKVEAVAENANASESWKEPQYGHPTSPDGDPSVDTEHVSASPTDLSEEAADYSGGEGSAHAKQETAEEVKVEVPVTEDISVAESSDTQSVQHEPQNVSHVTESTPPYPVLQSPTPPTSAIDATLKEVDDTLSDANNPIPPESKKWWSGILSGQHNKN